MKIRNLFPILLETEADAEGKADGFEVDSA